MQVQDTFEINDVQAFHPSAIPKENLSHDHQFQLQDYLDGKTVVA